MNELDAKEQARFRELQDRADAVTLSASETQEWQDLTVSLERKELSYLAPALARQNAKNAHDGEKIRALNALIERKTALVARLQNLLNEAQAERAAINREVAKVTADGDKLAEFSAR